MHFSLFILLISLSAFASDKRLDLNTIDPKHKKEISVTLDPSSNFSEDVLAPYEQNLDEEKKKIFLKRRRRIINWFFKKLSHSNFDNMTHRMHHWYYGIKKRTHLYRARKYQDRHFNPELRDYVKAKRQHSAHWKTKADYEFEVKKQTLKVLMPQLDQGLFSSADKIVKSDSVGFIFAMGLNGGLGIGDGVLGKLISSKSKNQEKWTSFKKGGDFNIGLKIAFKKKDWVLYIEPFRDRSPGLGHITVPVGEAVAAFHFLKYSVSKDEGYIPEEDIKKMLFPVGFTIQNTEKTSSIGFMPGFAVPPLVSIVATYEIVGNRKNFFRLNVPLTPFKLMYRGCQWLFRAGK